MTDLRDQLQQSLGAAYVIERELGGGGMSRVFLATDTHLERPVVVKVLSPELAAGISAERFAREVRLAAQLQEPHIVPVLGDGVMANGLPYYTMPYVRGASLRQRMNEGAVPLAEAVRILRDVAKALDYAHGRGVVHRDIKPENVLLHEGTAVVSDFGIAKALSAARDGARTPQRVEAARGLPTGELTSVGTSLGTPAYMAPEQAAGDDVDHRADLYSWGVIAYELLAGQHPFAGKTTARHLLAAHIAEVPESLLNHAPDLPGPLAGLVMRTLEKAPSARPESAAAIIDQLDGIQFLVTSDPRVLVPSRPKRPPVHTVIAVAAGVMIVVAVAIVALRTGRFGTGHATATKDDASAITTVAVLPFVNTGSDPKDEYFSDGMTDELAHALAQLPSLRVAGRTSSYSFKGKNATSQDVGRALNVAGVIAGTVRRAGDRLRITAELTSARDGLVIWSKTVENRSADVFQVQDEVTRELVAAIAPALRGQSATRAAEANRGTADPEAYDLYLRGRYFWARRGGDNVKRAIDYFQRAIAKDPSFARAHAGLAQSYAVMRSYVDVPADSMSALALSSANRAIALDSTLSDAHAAHAFTLFSRVRFRDAERSYLAAIARDPANPNTRFWHAINLLGLGLVDSACAEASRAVAADPMSAVFANLQAGTLMLLDQAPAAIDVASKAIKLDSTFGPSYITLARSYLQAGLPASALHVLDLQRSASRPTPATRTMYLIAYAELDRWASVERLSAEIRSSGASVTEAVELALLNDDRQAAIDALERGLTPQGGLIVDIASPGCDPILQSLHEEPRYLALMARLGMHVCANRTPRPFRTRPSRAVRRSS